MAGSAGTQPGELTTAPNRPAQGPPPPQIVLELLPGQGFAINGQPIAESGLDATLRHIYATRQAKLIFIKAADDRKYEEVVAAMNRSRSAGVQVIGLVPR